MTSEFDALQGFVTGATGLSHMRNMLCEFLWEHGDVIPVILLDDVARIKNLPDILDKVRREMILKRCRDLGVPIGPPEPLPDSDIKN